MKHLIAGIFAVIGLTIALPAVAQHNHHGLKPLVHKVQPHPRVVHNHHFHRHHAQRHWHPHHGWIWVVPTVIGGAVVYDIIRRHNDTAPIITEEVVRPAPVAPTKVVECTEWREIEGHDGKVYRERSCKEVVQ